MEKELKQKFEEVCNAYLDAFVKRHDLASRGLGRSGRVYYKGTEIERAWAAH